MFSRFSSFLPSRKSALRGILCSGCALAVMAWPFGTAVAADKGAKENSAWFVPKSSAPPAPKAHAAPRRQVEEEDGSLEEQNMPSEPPVLPLPPVPVPPPVAKEAPPPAATIGILSIQGVMALSTAAQEMQEILGRRRDALAQRVQKEESAWRAQQQQLQMEAHALTSEQIQKRERKLQERRAKDQREFGREARIIQEAYQVAFHQIERELEQRNGIIAEVAGAHAMNLVLHAEQVVLHVDGQDITEEVAARLNKILPHVYIPPADKDPEVLAKSGSMPTTADEARLMGQAPAPVDATASAGGQSVVRKPH